jgi:hypothetical protein
VNFYSVITRKPLLGKVTVLKIQVHDLSAVFSSSFFTAICGRQLQSIATFREGLFLYFKNISKRI